MGVGPVTAKNCRLEGRQRPNEITTFQYKITATIGELFYDREDIALRIFAVPKAHLFKHFVFALQATVQGCRCKVIGSYSTRIVL